MLPRVLPSLEPFRIRAFCRATRYLGGDFYDFIQTGDTELTGVLADVSGKGTPAELLSSCTLGALNMEFRSSAEPETVLNGFNKLLCEKTPMSKFVTLFLFQLDEQGCGRYINVGHNTAYLFRAASDEFEELTSGGMPLGMFPLPACQSAPLRLRPGDTLVVYTDGLTDAENRGPAVWRGAAPRVDPVVRSARGRSSGIYSARRTGQVHPGRRPDGRHHFLAR